MKKEINDNYLNLNVELINSRDLIIKGSLKNPSNYKKKILIAPNPPDIRASYSGTALPFPCEEIALENTKNYLEITDNGVIDVKFIYPNSFYSPDGYKKIVSPIILIIDDIKIIHELDDFCPLKTLRDRVRGNPSFYALKEILLPVATAENTMNNYSKAKIINNIA